MKKEILTLQQLTLEDLAALKKISRNTYSEAFSLENSKKNMSQYLNEAFNDEKLARELEEKNSAFYFANHNNETVGYIKINLDTAQTEFKDKNAMEIERIYIIKKHQRQGFGRQLLTTCIEKAKQEKKRYLWLGVWNKNKKAIAFYKTFGFKIFSTHAFKMGDELQTDYVMKLIL